MSHANSNAFRLVVHEKIFKGFCYMSPRAWPFVTPGTSFEQTWIS